MTESTTMTYCPFCNNPTEACECLPNEDFAVDLWEEDFSILSLSLTPTESTASTEEYSGKIRPRFEANNPTQYQYSPSDLKKTLEQYNFAYHVTASEKVSTILDQGLIPMKSKDNPQEFPVGQICFFLRGFESTYHGYGIHQHKDPSVLRVAISDLLNLGLALDRTYDDIRKDLCKGKTATEILHRYGVFVCCSTVPPEFIELAPDTEDETDIQNRVKS